MDLNTTNLIGTWGLKSYTVSTPDNQTKNLWGENAKGLLIYQENGYMSVQVADAERPLFDNQHYLSGSHEEINAAFERYTAYFGRYELLPGNIIHHIVDQSLYPNWSGITLTRFITLSHDELILTTPPIEMEDGVCKMKMDWHRIP